jgi:hypothetical protein
MLSCDGGRLESLRPRRLETQHTSTQNKRFGMATDLELYHHAWQPERRERVTLDTTATLDAMNSVQV